MLALMGPTGLGKSTAAAWAAYLAAREYPWNSRAGGGSSWEPIVWLNAEDVALLQGWFNDGKRQYEECSRAWLLVIDDAGHEASRPAIAALTDLLQRRMDGRKATVLSTNLRGAGFATRYGAPVVDRMKVGAFIPELGQYESLRGREPGEDG
jgi:DNA replication protein DnaC